MASRSVPKDETEAKNKVLKEKLDEIISKLGLSAKFANDAFASLKTANEQYVLEGDDSQWIVCVIYILLRYVANQPSTGTTDQHDVSLVEILKAGNVSIIEFFDHLKRWINMITVTRKIQEKIAKCEQTFAVCTVIFKKYKEIFRYAFSENEQENESNTASKRPKRRESSKAKQSNKLFLQQLFTFGWKFYVCLKSLFPLMSDDLVNCFHLLICCVDCICTNLMADDELRVFLHDRYKNMKEVAYGSSPILADLCEAFGGVVVEGKRIRSYAFQPKLKQQIERRQLRGNSETFGDLLDGSNIQENIRQFDAMYESNMLLRGEVDERIFLLDDEGSERIGTPYKTSRPEIAYLPRKSIQACLERYLTEGSSAIPTPVSAAVQNLTVLSNILADATIGPSPELEGFFERCEENPKQEIVKRIHNMVDTYIKYCREHSTEIADADDSMSTCNQRIMYAEALYYRELTKILRQERTRAPGADLTNILKQEFFHRSLFACCVEILAFVYNSKCIFPWVLKVFNIAAYDFYKVIELVVRADSELPRDVIKHLQIIEETCLEEFAWLKDSPLWETLEMIDYAVPAADECLQPANYGKLRPMVQGGQTPLGLLGRYGSPLRMPLSAKRRLVDDDAEALSPSKRLAIRGFPSPITMSAIRLPSSPHTSESPLRRTGKIISSPANLNRSRRTGSIALFFRKVYCLTLFRLGNLCERLNIPNQPLFQQHCWTLMEWIFQNHCNLLADRHLDQIILCSVYVIAKVLNEEQSFQEIMRCYRLQPQAKSRVYRSVPLNEAIPRSSEASPTQIAPPAPAPAPTVTQPKKPPKRTPRTPQRFAAELRSQSTLPVGAEVAESSGDHQNATELLNAAEENRGDIIRFYNQCFVKRIEDYVRHLQTAGVDSVHNKEASAAVSLSPVPIIKLHPLTPRRRVADGVYVSPLRSPHLALSPSRPLQYAFCKSPHSDLTAINSMIRNNSNTPGSAGRGNVVRRLDLEKTPPDSSSSFSGRILTDRF